MRRLVVLVALLAMAPAVRAGGREQKFQPNLPLRILHERMIEAKPGTYIYSWATGRPVEVKPIPGFGGAFFRLPHEGQYSWVRSSLWRYTANGFKFEKGRLEETPAPQLAWDDDDDDDD